MPYATLRERLPETMASAAISKGRPAHPALREAISKGLGAAPGEPGAHLAEPVYEIRWGWTPAEFPFRAAPTLRPATIQALAQAEEAGRFPAERHPHSHQAQAWEALGHDANHNVVITSGTGSGKTEAFMVPILDDLVRAQEDGGSADGVRALVLYPLNALIEDQQRRLSAWTRPFGGRVRFGLYNGNTPEEGSPDLTDPGRVTGRQELRARPPGLLVTNTTMLEYILARPRDRSLLRQSQGKLRYVVLDEAHSYGGSRAAELALLLRRTFLAFGVEPSDVRLVLASATLDEGAGEGAALKLLADLSGRPQHDGRVIRGRPQRSPPPPSADPAWVRLHEALSGGPMTEGALAEAVFESATPETRAEVARRLEAATQAQPPVQSRAHYVVKPLQGAWSCLSPACPARPEGWPFGGLLLAPQDRCSACQALVLPVFVCRRCGQEALMADINGQGDGLVAPKGRRPEAAIAAGPDFEVEYAVDPATGAFDGPGVDVHFEEGGADDPLACPRCDHRESGGAFRSLKTDESFTLGTLMEPLTSWMPAQPERPFRGRQLLSFADSRQGAARMVLSLQSESLRLWFRGLLWHRLSGRGPVPWVSLGAELTTDPDLQRARALLEELEGRAMSVDEVARDLLLRELMRRPDRGATAETMGLVAFRYPQLLGARPPEIFARIGGTRSDWVDLLHLAVDTAIRGRWGWEGLHAGRFRMLATVFHPKGIHPPEGEQEPRWPISGRTKLSGLVARAYDLAPDDARLAPILREVWRALTVGTGLLAEGADGWRLPERHVELFSPERAWLCPVKRQLHDRTLGGLTAAGSSLQTKTQATVVALPRLPDSAEPEAVWRWLRSDPAVAAGRAAGWWSEFHDRVAQAPALLLAAEHTAQVDRTALRDTVERFQAGQVSVMCCSTTLEMGVDIGSLSVVTMANVPPSPANWLQRAGRAGRREQAAALTLTVARPLPHDQALFEKPTWPFTTPIHLSPVQLESEKIVWRHVQAWLLAGWFGEDRPGMDRLRLTVGEFLDHVDPFVAWLGAPLPRRVSRGLERVVAGTALGGMAPPALAATAAGRFADWAAGVREFDQVLVAELEALGPGAPGRATLQAQRAFQAGAFLLGALASRQILPAHGFPTGIVSFVYPLTPAEVARRGGDEDRQGGFPSRARRQAIRDYAPGRAVVVEARVHRSVGLTLGRRLSHREGVPTEVMSTLRVCKACGNLDVNLSTTCACGGPFEHAVSYVEPASFTADLSLAPGSLIEEEHLRRQDPLVTSAPGDFQPIAASPCSSRASPRGQVFEHHGGMGFAVCFLCGLAVPEAPSSPGPAHAGPPVSPLTRPHPSPKAGRPCAGHPPPDQDRRRLFLAAHFRTDVVEFRVRDALGAVLPKEALRSGALALRNALADHLAVEARELQVALAGPAKDPTIALFDAADGGAGLSTQLPGVLGPVVAAARARMAGCDCVRACVKCLLDFQSQHDEGLDRRAAIAVLDALCPMGEG